jgi:thiamine biosynthesis protein ThiS
MRPGAAGTLIELFALDPARVAVEQGGTIVRHPPWSGCVPASGARLEIVHFVGGG